MTTKRGGLDRLMWLAFVAGWRARRRAVNERVLGTPRATCPYAYGEWRAEVIEHGIEDTSDTVEP